MLKLSIADIKHLALISKVSQDEVDSVEGIALVSLEALAKPILESDDPEAIDAYNKLKAFLEQQKKEAITNPVLEGFDYGTSPLVSGDIPERLRKESGLLDSPYEAGFYVGMNTDLEEGIAWDTYIENMTELPTSKEGITEGDKIEFGKGFTEGRRSKGYGGEKISKKATIVKKEGEKVGGDMKKLAYLDPESFEGPIRVIVTDSISDYYRQEVVVKKFMRGGRKSGKYKCTLVEEGGITAYFRPDQLTTYADLVEPAVLEEPIEPTEPIISDPPIAFYKFEREGNNVLVSDGESRYLVEKNASYYDELELNKVYSDEEIEYHIEMGLWGKTADINVTPIIEWKVGKKLEGYLLFEEPSYYVTLVRLEDLGDTSDDYDSIDHKTYRDEHLTNLAKDNFPAMGFKEYIARVPTDIGFKTEQEISMDEEMRSLREKLLGDVAKREER